MRAIATFKLVDNRNAMNVAEKLTTILSKHGLDCGADSATQQCKLSRQVHEAAVRGFEGAN